MRFALLAVASLLLLLLVASQTVIADWLPIGSTLTCMFAASAKLWDARHQLRSSGFLQILACLLSLVHWRG